MKEAINCETVVVASLYIILVIYTELMSDITSKITPKQSSDHFVACRSYYQSRQHAMFIFCDISWNLNTAIISVYIYIYKLFVLEG